MGHLTKQLTPILRLTRPRRASRAGTAPNLKGEHQDPHPTEIHIWRYTNDECALESKADELALNEALDSKEKIWIDIQGFGDRARIEAIASKLKIHKLWLEDVLSNSQRPKVESSAEGELPSILLVTRQQYFAEAKIAHLVDEQLSLVVMEKVLVTFQENHEDRLEPVRKRLLNGKGTLIRIQDPIYLAYALMDTVGDHYFPLLEGLSEELLNLEEPLSRTPMKRHLIQLLRIKRDLNDLKRAAWPMRDVASTVMQTEHPLLPSNLRPYFRDLYDNSIHILDLTEGLRENVSSLQDLYYSSLNLRMNEIMKVLTIISAIFIPLSFVAGVYGMNFMEQDPYTGQKLPNNMPELRSPYGYALAWVIMGLIVVIQIGYFWRKGWLRNQ